jgi:hypothetical protein
MTETSEFDEEQDKIDRGLMEAQIKEQMAAEVKDKITDMIQGGVGRQLIESRDALNFLVGQLGIELTTVVCALTKSDLIAFRKTKVPKRGKRIPSPLQNRNIAAAYMIVDILSSSAGPETAREWLMSYNEYLFGIPALEIRIRPEDVRMAALHMLAGG